MAVARPGAPLTAALPGSNSPIANPTNGGPGAPWYQLWRALWTRTGAEQGVSSADTAASAASLQVLAAFAQARTPSQATALPYAITVGVSPFAYPADVAGTVLISDGTVSDVEFSRDGATSFKFPIAGPVPVHQGDVVTVTYTVAPTLTMIPA